MKSQPHVLIAGLVGKWKLILDHIGAMHRGPEQAELIPGPRSLDLVPAGGLALPILPTYIPHLDRPELQEERTRVPVGRIRPDEAEGLFRIPKMGQREVETGEVEVVTVPGPRAQPMRLSG